MIIIQGSNKPIYVEFSEDVTDYIFRITLWDANRHLLKTWTNDDITIEGASITLPLTQTETLGFNKGSAILEMKWIDTNNNIEFADHFKLDIVNRFDKKTIGG